MTDYRIVFNEQTDRYRIERRRWWGWDFVLDPCASHYATFDSLIEARDFACRALAGKAPTGVNRNPVLRIRATSSLAHL